MVAATSYLTTQDETQPSVPTMTFAIQPLDCEVSQSFDVINKTLLKRKQSKRDIITQALVAGRHLSYVKTLIPHGQWESEILKNTHYNTLQSARVDIKLWDTWQPYIERLLGAGVINNIDNPEQEFVAQLSDDIVLTTDSALSRFVTNGVPEGAIELALSHLENNGYMSIKQANKIINVSKEIEKLETPEQRQLATELVQEHNVTNPDVIRSVPTLMNEQDVLDTIRNTGTIVVPSVDGNTRQIKIDEASGTDIALTVRNEQVENELSRIASLSGDLLNREFEYALTAEGSALQVINHLERYQALAPQGTVYKLVVYVKG